VTTTGGGWRHGNGDYPNPCLALSCSTQRAGGTGVGGCEGGDRWRPAGPVYDIGRLTCPGSAVATAGTEEERTEQQWQQGPETLTRN